MAAVKRSRVGNAALYIGLPWAQRKSLPRDSRGFEPLEQYFAAGANSDDDSSDTDTEELIQEEKRKRNLRRKTLKHPTVEPAEPKSPIPPSAKSSPKQPSVGSDVYSPLATSPQEVSSKVMPSRLSFGSSSDTEKPPSKSVKKTVTRRSRDAVFKPSSSDENTNQASNTERSFHTTKTSTQQPVQKKPANRQRAKKQKLSTIQPLAMDSDSDAEDEVLQSLMGGTDNTHFQGLSQLTRKTPSVVKRKLAFKNTTDSTQSQQSTANKKQVSRPKPPKRKPSEVRKQSEVPDKRKYAKKAVLKDASSVSNVTPESAGSAGGVSGSAGTTSAVAGNQQKKRKKPKKVTIGKTRKRPKQPVSQTVSSDEGLEITTSPGGRKYRRHRVEPAKSHTPGVRRSHRTRIAPVKFWEGEQVEYDTRRKSGALMKGVLVPVEVHRAPAPRRPVGAKESISNEEFSPLPISDVMGNTVELRVVRTLSSADKVDNVGVPAQPGDEVIISKLFSSMETSNGVITINAFGEKGKCRTSNYEMFFYVLKGSAVFEVNQQEFTLMPEMLIHVPAGTAYAIRNTKRNPTTVFFYTHMLTAK